MGDARAHAARTTPLEYKCNRFSGDGFRTASLETLRGRIRDIIKGPAGPVAIQPLETLQPRASQEQGSGSTPHR